MGGNSDIVDLAYDRIKIDDDRYKSVLFQFGKKEVWLPRKLIEIDTDAKVVTVPIWKAELDQIEGHAV